MIINTNRMQMRRQESGFTTAELLGNAALGVVALAVIWGLMGGVGADVVRLVRQQMGLPTN